MTLNDELLENLYRNSHDDSECLKIKFENINVVLKGSEQIAQDFAIGFAEWCVAKAMGVYSFKLNDGELEQFKKEKGL